MSKFGTNLKIAWSYFNCWRKKYWITRTLIILLLFFPILCDNPIMCDLVKLACDAIFSAAIPQYENALCKYYKNFEIKRLQTSIIVFADKNQNGILDADEIEFLKSKGCDTEEIRKLAIKANMDKLAEDAGKLGLLPPAYSTTQVRKNAFYAAHSETEFALTPLTDEVYDLIERERWFYPRFTEKQINELKIEFTEKEFREGLVVPDFCSWPTWRHGLLNALNYFTAVLGPLIVTSLWFSISIMLGLFSAITFKSHKKFMSVFFSLVFLFLLLFLKGHLTASLENFSDSSMRYYNLFALVMFSIVAGLSGFKISGSIKNKTNWRILTPLIIGFLMILWSFNLVFLFYDPYYCGIGCLISPVSGQFSGIGPYNAFWVIFATILISVSLGFFYRYYQREIFDCLYKLKRR